MRRVVRARIWLSTICLTSTALLSACSAGCSCSKPADGSAQTSGDPSAGGAESPKAAFEAVKKAMDGRNYRAVFGMFTKDTQTKYLMACLGGCRFATLGPDRKPLPKKEKKLNALLAKHGVKPTNKPATPHPPDLAMTQMSRQLEAVKDRAGLLSDLTGFMSSHSNSVQREKLVALKDLKMDGAKATAKIVKQSQRGRQTVDVEFIKIGGRWYMRIVEWQQ